jgi:DNA-binding NarL/FixJ family response regulator
VLAARTERAAAAVLSDREREVLECVGAGMSNREIARSLRIAEKTVKAHLTSVFRRIGVTDRTQAALWAERHGISRRAAP